MQCCEILALLKLDISTNDPEKCTKSNKSLMLCFYTDSQQGAVLIFSQCYLPTKLCAEKKSPFITARV